MSSASAFFLAACSAAPAAVATNAPSSAATAVANGAPTVAAAAIAVAPTVAAGATTQAPTVAAAATAAATPIAAASATIGALAAGTTPTAGTTPASAAAATTPSSGSVVTVATNQKLGQILADSQGRTLYFFAKDSPGTSTCTGNCATTWPPFSSSVASPALPSGVPGELAVISRPDGTKQVTYNGMPLYYYSKDANPGDTNGQGVGKVWWVAPPGATLATPTPSSG